MTTFTALFSVYKNDSFENVFDCVESLLNQDNKQFDEIVVIVEGQIEDKILHYLKQRSPDRIKLHTLNSVKGPLNYGLPSCLNYGIHISTSDYIVRIDSDDISTSDRLDEIYRFVDKNPEVALFGSHVQEFDESMKVPGKFRKVPIGDYQIKKLGKWRNPFNGPSVSFKRDVAIKIGGYPQVASNEDYCFWALFMKLGYTVDNINMTLVKMRAGKEIIKRRRGLRYAKGEVSSIKYLYAIGWIGFPSFVITVTIRRIIRLLPTSILKLVYSKFLRV